MSLRFKDRTDAGRYLAQYPKIKALADQNPIVLALPRGGVPVAFEYFPLIHHYRIAKALNAPLDALIVRKLGIPYQPEVAFGAISIDGVKVLNSDFIHRIRLSDKEMNAVIAKESMELERRNSLYRGNRPFPNLKDRIVLIVDDGIATGATLKAGILAVKQLKARKTIAVSPVGPEDSVLEISKVADDVICPRIPHDFHAVGLWYESFPQTTDQEVIKLLNYKFKEE